MFVTGGGLVMACAAVLIAVWPAWSGALVAAAALGIGFGAYSAVDFALLTQVLPAARDRGKDLGVLNIASSLPQVLAPVIAAPIVTGLAGTRRSTSWRPGSRWPAPCWSIGSDRSAEPGSVPELRTGPILPPHAHR